MINANSNYISGSETKTLGKGEINSKHLHMYICSNRDHLETREDEKVKVCTVRNESKKWTHRKNGNTKREMKAPDVRIAKFFMKEATRFLNIQSIYFYRHYAYRASLRMTYRIYLDILDAFLEKLIKYLHAIHLSSVKSTSNFAARVCMYICTYTISGAVQLRGHCNVLAEIWIFVSMQCY